MVKFFEIFSKNFKGLLLNDNEYNVIIDVGEAPINKSFKAHSIVLKSRSLYFKNTLNTMV